MKYTLEKNMLGGVIRDEFNNMVELDDLVNLLNNQDIILKVAEKIIRQHLSEAHVNEYMNAKWHILSKDLPKFEPKNCRCRLTPE